MTENRLPDLLAKIAIDPAFAEHARNNPKAVADEYGLDAKAVAMLEQLSVTDAAQGPAPLAERLSRSSLFFGGSLAAAGDAHTADAGVGDDGTDLASGEASGKTTDLAGGHSLLGTDGGKPSIIGPDGPGGGNSGGGLGEPGGLAEGDEGFRPIFHPPTGRIDDGVGFDGPGGPGGLDGKLDGLLGHGGPGGIDVDGLLGDGGPGGPGGPGGLDGKLDGLLGHGGPGAGLGGLDATGGLGGAGPLGLDGPSGPADFAGPGGFDDTGLAAGVTISEIPDTPGGGGDGQHHGSGTVTVHDEDGTEHVYDYSDDGFSERPPPVTGGAVHADGGTGGAVHADGGTGGAVHEEVPKAPPPVTGEGSHPAGYPSHASDEGPKDPQAGGHGQAPVGDGEGGVDPNRAPKGDGEGGDPNQAPGEGGGGDVNTGTVITGGSRSAPVSSAGSVFVPPSGTEDPTGGAAAPQAAGESTP